MEDTGKSKAIEVAVIITATPRVVAALLRSEGYEIPTDWLSWWVPVSAALAVAWAVVEALAFSFMFAAWRRQRDSRATRILWLAAIAAILFIIVLAPSVAASVKHQPLDEILSEPWALWLWSASVVASNIAIVAGVGYVRRDEPAHTARPASQSVVAASQAATQSRTYTCPCGWSASTTTAYAAHARRCADYRAAKVSANGNTPHSQENI